MMNDSIQEENMKQLVNTYRQRPIVLYVGAGSSMGDKGCKLGIPGWWGLLESIMTTGGDTTGEDRQRLRDLQDPWDAADFVLSRMPGPDQRKHFQNTLRSVIEDPVHYPGIKREESRHYKLISNAFLKQNQTLNGIVAFCGGIAAILVEKESREPNGYFVCQPNPRVRALLTTNYDPFLEAASTSKYRTDLLKPVAAYGSDAGNLGQVPVFHIHGYVPHIFQKSEDKPRIPFLESLVLDRTDYEKAWESRDVFGPTMLHQIHYLRSYTVLFIGFSFSDAKVNELLGKIKRDEFAFHKRSHFALLDRRDYDRKTRSDADFFDKLGVIPIIYDDPLDIPKLLGKLYRAGLKTDYKFGTIPVAGVLPHSHARITNETFSLEPGKYWDMLVKSRLSYAKV